MVWRPQVGVAEPDIPEDEAEVISGSLEGDQYDREGAHDHHSDSNDESEPLYSGAAGSWTSSSGEALGLEATAFLH